MRWSGVRRMSAQRGTGRGNRNLERRFSLGAQSIALREQAQVAAKRAAVAPVRNNSDSAMLNSEKPRKP